MHRRRCLTALAALPLAACAAAPRPRPPATIAAQRGGLWVDAGRERGAIGTLVYGSNTGPWQTVAPDQWRQARDAGMTLVRWPGGNWGDENDATPTQLDEYIVVCRRYGFTPMVCVRLYEGTPERAAELVRLANVTRRYGIRHWAIGNEPDLFVKKRGAAVYNVDDYVRDFRAYRAAMKAVDPSIIVIGPEISQYTAPTGYPTDVRGVPWMQGFLEAMAGDIDMVSFHRYPFGEPPPTPETLLAEPPAWTRAMASLRQQIRKTSGGRAIPIAITEANADWTGRVDTESGTNSHLNALWWTDVLGRLIDAGAHAVAQFCLGAIPQQGIGLFGPISYDTRPLPTFETYRLFGRFGQRLLASGSDDPTLPIVAARRDDGALTVIAVNHAAQVRPLPLQVAGFTVDGPADVWSFAENHRVRQSGGLAVDRLALEPRSATLLALQGRYS